MGLGSGVAFLGYSFRRGNPEPWRAFDVPYLMINAFDFSSRFGSGERSDHTVQTLLGYNGYSICDSGGYQLMQGAHDVDVDTVIAAQRALNPDLVTMLDNSRDFRAHLRAFREVRPGVWRRVHANHPVEHN